MINSLTPEQEAALPHYRQKWQSYALSTQPLDRGPATAAIQVAYATINRRTPEIQFFPSPYAALKSITAQADAFEQMNYEVSKLLEQKIAHFLWKQLDTQLEKGLRHSLSTQLCWPHTLRLWPHLWDQLETCEDLGELRELRQWMDTEPLGDLDGMEWSLSGSLFDFCFAVLDCEDGQAAVDTRRFSFSGQKTSFPSRWQIYQSIAQHCAWFFPVEGLCLVSDRPRFLAWDQNYCLHAEEQPAVVFADGFSIYVHHGKTYF